MGRYFFIFSLLLLLISCEDENDPNQFPVAGNGGVIFASIASSSSVTLNWAAASDNKTAAADLYYKVVRSSSNNITSADECEANGVVLKDWTKNITSFSATGLTQGVLYYFNVLVKDGDGHKSAYSPLAQSTKYQWVVMYYVDADNDLEQYLMNDLNEIESVNLADKEIKVIALVDRIGSHWSGDGDWADTRAFEVGYDSAGYNSTLSSATKRIAIPTLGISTSSTVELNMGDPQVLSTFIAFTKSTYPADHYMLLMTNHGDGWKAKNLDLLEEDESPVSKAICYDATAHDILKVNEVSSAIQTGTGGVKLDIVAMDACLMGGVEVAYALKDVAGILVASSETIPGYGFPYTQIWQALKNQSGDISASLFAQTMVNKYYQTYTSGGHVENSSYTTQDITLSAIDLSKMATLALAIDDLASTYISDGYTNIDALLGVQKFELNDYVDLYDYCQRESNYSDEINAVKTALTDAVILHKSGSSYSNSHGLAIYFPRGYVDFDTNYNASNVQFIADGGDWRDYLFNLIPSSTDVHEVCAGSGVLGNNSSTIALYNAPCTNLVDGVDTQSYIFYPNDEDWFYIPDSNGNFSITLEVPDGVDYDIYLYGRSGGSVSYATAASGGGTVGNGVDEVITMPSSSSYSSYFVRVVGYGTHHSRTAPYQLTYEDN